MPGLGLRLGLRGNRLIRIAAAPPAVGSLPDLTLRRGLLLTPIDLSKNFSGAGLSYALAPGSAALPAGLTLSSTGILSGTPTALTDGVSIVVRGTNDGGFADSGFTLKVEAATAPTKTLGTIVHRGVTFTLSRPMPVVHSCLGEPAIVNEAGSGGFRITAIGPASAPIVGNTGTWVGNGAMRDPYLPTSTYAGVTSAAQGYDAILQEADAPGYSASGIDYSAALNVDPAISGPIAFAPGQTGSIRKSVRASGVKDPNGVWQSIDRYVDLTVLSETPPTGFLMPGVSALVKTVEFTEADVDYNVLRREPIIPGLPGMDIALERIAPTLPLHGPGGQQLRRMQVEYTTGAGSNYSRDYGLTRGDALTALHSDYADAQKRETFLRVIQHGLHMASSHDRGYRWTHGAGQSYGHIAFLYFAAFALKSSAMLAKAQDTLSSTFTNYIWIDEDEVGMPTASETNNAERYRFDTYFDSDVGIPEWESDSENRGTYNAAPQARYRDMTPVGEMEALAIGLLQGGPGGLSGVEAMHAEGPFDATNPRAAALAYYDRTQTWNYARIIGFNSYRTAPRAAAWTARRPLLGLASWTGRPDWSERDSNVSAIAGGYSYDWSLDEMATEAITRRDRRHSLDGIQWVETLGVPPSGSVVGLTRGLSHHVGYRTVSASGAGRWSPTYEKSNAGGERPDPRNRVTPSGTVANASPANTVPPRVHYKPYPKWAGAEYAPAPATLPLSLMQREPLILYAGVGYWTMSPAPAVPFRFQWRRDGVAIAGATSASYTWNWPADGGHAIDCVVTATNSRSAASVATPAVAGPAQVEPAAPTTWARVATDGTAYASRTGGFFGASDGRQGTFAFKGRPTGGQGTFRSLLTSGTTNRQLQFQFSTTNNFAAYMRDSGNVVRLQMLSAGVAFNNAVGDVTILASWNLVTGVGQIYVNGVSRLAANPTLTNADLRFATTQDIALLAEANGAYPFVGQCDYLYLAPEFVDLSVAANRAKFGDPVAMTAWGRGPTGTRPLLYARGPASDWSGGQANKGRGGGFAASRTLTDV